MKQRMRLLLAVFMILLLFVLMQYGDWTQTTDAQGIGSTEFNMRRQAQGIEAKAQLDLKELSLRLESLETYMNVQYNAQTKSHAAK